MLSLQFCLFKRIIFPLLSSAVCFRLIVFPSNFGGSAEILGRRSLRHTPPLKGLFVMEGRRPWSVTVWPAVFTQTLSRSHTHTHTPGRERSDGLLQESLGKFQLLDRKTQPLGEHRTVHVHFFTTARALFLLARGLFPRRQAKASQRC